MVEELYLDLATKAAALGYSLIQNHPFADGNKRVGHGAMEVFHLLNGHENDASVDEQLKKRKSLLTGGLKFGTPTERWGSGNPCLPRECYFSITLCELN